MWIQLTNQGQLHNQLLMAGQCEAQSLKWSTTSICMSSTSELQRWTFSPWSTLSTTINFSVAAYRCMLALNSRCRSHVFSFSCPLALNWEWASRRLSRYTLLHRLEDHINVFIRWCKVASQFYKPISDRKYKSKLNSGPYQLEINFRITSPTAGRPLRRWQLYYPPELRIKFKFRFKFDAIKLWSQELRCFSQSQRRSGISRQSSITPCNHLSAVTGALRQ